MSKLGDLDCAECRRPMYRGTGSLDQGSICLPCRRRLRLAEKVAMRPMKACEKCGAPFVGRKATQRFCSPRCRGRGNALTTTQRGYGTEHQQERARWKPIVESGRAYCTETHCFHASRWIKPGTPWELAHDHHSSTNRYKGPAHRVCNRREQQIRAGYKPAPAPRRLAL